MVIINNVYNSKYKLIMRKIVKILIITFIISLICFLGFKTINKLKLKKETAVLIQSIPNFSFETINGRNFTQNNLINKKIIFLYFNSDCDYCKSEANKIKNNLNIFKEIQLIFVSFEDKSSIINFSKNYNLNNKKNIVFLEDKKFKFSEIFDANTIPTTIIYDENKKLLKKFTGAAKFDKILRVLNKND